MNKQQLLGIAAHGIVPPMDGTSALRVFYQRIVLLVVVGCALALLGVFGWRVFVDHVGGRFVYAPEDAAWVLSDDARALVDAAFDGIDWTGVTDYQVGVISTGTLGDAVINNDSYYRRDRAGQAGPLAWVATQLRLAAAGVGAVDAVDARYVSRLLRQIRAMSEDYRVRLLARGWRYDDAGRRDAAATYTHVANAYVAWLARQAPETIVPVVSIHPYRQDALQLLAHWADQGVGTVAWWPVRQNIDLADPRAQAFYRALAAHGMALQLPVGMIETVYATGRGWVDPRALRAALDAGVTVIANVQADAAAPDGRPVIDHVLPLLRGRAGERLRISLAGALAGDAAPDVLAALLQQPQLYSHLRYASGYPLSALNARIDLDALADQGFIDGADVAPLREIYQVNPLLFVFAVLRTVRLPHTQLRLPVSVFTGGG